MNKTTFECIKEMNIEELIELIILILKKGSACHNCVDIKESCYNENNSCYRGIKKWLESKVKEDDRL